MWTHRPAGSVRAPNADLWAGRACAHTGVPVSQPATVRSFCRGRRPPALRPRTRGLSTSGLRWCRTNPAPRVCRRPSRQTTRRSCHHHNDGCTISCRPRDPWLGPFQHAPRRPETSHLVLGLRHGTPEGFWGASAFLDCGAAGILASRLRQATAGAPRGCRKKSTVFARWSGGGRRPVQHDATPSDLHVAVQDTDKRFPGHRSLPPREAQALGTGSTPLGAWPQPLRVFSTKRCSFVIAAGWSVAPRRVL